MSFHVPEKYRLTTGKLGSDESYGNNGCFVIRRAKFKSTMNIIASDEGGWEHVSVSFPHRTPTWEEMCWVKDLFWDETDCVVQYHPPKKNYVNRHSHCLHLWRPTQEKLPQPPRVFVG